MEEIHTIYMYVQQMNELTYFLLGSGYLAGPTQIALRGYPAGSGQIVLGIFRYKRSGY